ncbi:MAG: GPW/gp25 family protein [Candidatus Promineofilum sp.]|jgi:phage baseplate assembly protein W|nr:GPW/gp25 family protein [Promineifilum sp.]
MTTAADLYGKSLAFPPRVGANGQMVWSEGELNVRESIALILQTQPGERLLLPDFGCGLDRFLFEPNSIATLRQIQEEIKLALSRWERRIRLDDVRVATNPADPRAVDITLYYTLVATQTQERLSMVMALQG